MLLSELVSGSKALSGISCGAENLNRYTWNLSKREPEIIPCLRSLSPSSTLFPVHVMESGVIAGEQLPTTTQLILSVQKSRARWQCFPDLSLLSP